MSPKLGIFNDKNCNSLNSTIIYANDSINYCLNGNASYPIYATCDNSVISATVCKRFDALSLTIPSIVSSTGNCRAIAFQSQIPILFIDQSCGQDWSTFSNLSSQPTSQATQGFSAGTIIGISIGVAAFAFFIGFMIWYFKILKKMMSNSKGNSQSYKEPVIIEPYITSYAQSDISESPIDSTAILAAHKHYSLTSRGKRYSYHLPRVNLSPEDYEEPTPEKLILSFQDFANTALLVNLIFPLQFPDSQVQQLYEQGQLITAVYTSIKKCVEEGSELETVTPRVFSDLSVYGYDSRLELLIKRAIEFYRIYKSLKANLVICKVDQKFDPGRNEWKGDTTSTMVSLIPGLEVDGIVLIKEIVTTRSYSDFKIW